jgi:cation diffusion facilitator family transporter
MINNDIKTRSNQGTIASIIGILVNILLAVGKMAVGLICGVISMVADGMNNLTDCGSSAISMLSFKLSSKPADKEHPYGHERIEYVCSVAVAFIILLVAFETIKSSIEKIISPSASDFSLLAIIVLVVSILAKFGLFFYYRITAKRINSDILKATSIDSLTDAISTLITLVQYVAQSLQQRPFMYKIIGCGMM